MGKRPEELTDRIERFEVLEDQFGILLEALHAVFVSKGGKHLSIHFDIVSRSNRPRSNFAVAISIYNAKKQLIETGNEYVNADKFIAIKSCSYTSFLVTEPPSLIRLIPQEM